MTALDISPVQIGTGRKLCKALSADIEFLQEDATELRFASDTFDSVLIKDAVSHIVDVGRVYRAVRRGLKPGGVLLIWDDRNGLCPRVRQATEEVWSISEFGDQSQCQKYGISVNFWSSAGGS